MLGHVRVLDGQAPDVEVVADGDNDVDDEAAVHANRNAQQEKHVGDLVDTVTQDARPAEAGVLFEEGAQGVDDAEDERQAKHVEEGEGQLGEVGGDHAADAISIDDTGKEHEGNQVVVKNVGLQEEVRANHGPDAEEGNEAEQGAEGALATGTARADDVERRLDRVQDEDDGALDHVPVGEGHVVYALGEAEVLRDAEETEHALLPEVRTAEIARQGVDGDQEEDALDGAVDDAESQGLGVVLIPGLNVEGEEG